MKIESSRVQKLYLTEVDKLDPITIYLEDFGPGQGKITIECWGQSWTSFWGSMGDGWGVTRFFLSCDNHYLSKNLSRISSTVNLEGDELTQALKTIICKDRREQELTKKEARDRWTELEISFRDEDRLWAAIGPEFWHRTPTTTNPDWEYLQRIINATKEGLQMAVDQGLIQ